MILIYIISYIKNTMIQLLSTEYVSLSYSQSHSIVGKYASVCKFVIVCVYVCVCVCVCMRVGVFVCVGVFVYV